MTLASLPLCAHSTLNFRYYCVQASTPPEFGLYLGIGACGAHHQATTQQGEVMANHNVKSWATVRETSVEIAEAIFELAENDETLAQKIWEEGSDEALQMAFAKTNANQLFWGEETVERKNV